MLLDYRIACKHSVPFHIAVVTWAFFAGISACAEASAEQVRRSSRYTHEAPVLDQVLVLPSMPTI